MKKPMKSKDAAAAERKIWRQERTALRRKRRSVLAEAGKECRTLLARLKRIEQSTASRLSVCDKREAILNQRLGA